MSVYWQTEACFWLHVSSYAPADVHSMWRYSVSNMDLWQRVVLSEIFPLFVEILMWYPVVIELATSCLLVPMLNPALRSFLRDFARSRKLRITGFWYEHSSPHHWTWYSNIGAVVKVNHILVSGYFRTAGFTVIDWPWLPYGSTSKSTKSPVSTLGVFHLDRQESGVCPWVCCCISNRFVVLKHL